MNRIQISPLATISKSPPKPSPGALAARVSAAERLRSRQASSPALFAPLHYERGYSYPLIVWLHSNGDCQAQIQRIMPSVSLRNYVAVAPQAANGNPTNGFQWEQTSQGIEQAQTAIIDAIDYARMKFNISSQRIFLAGYGAGGTMAFRVALQLSQILAGVVSINGPLPNGLTPLRDWMTCRRLPIFWAHCRRSANFDENLLCGQLKLLHVAGFGVTLRQYPIGDELPTQSLSDLNRWIMESIESAIR